MPGALAKKEDVRIPDCMVGDFPMDGYSESVVRHGYGKYEENNYFDCTDTDPGNGKYLKDTGNNGFIRCSLDEAFSDGSYVIDYKVKSSATSAIYLTGTATDDNNTYDEVLFKDLGTANEWSHFRVNLDYTTGTEYDNIHAVLYNADTNEKINEVNTTTRIKVWNNETQKNDIHDLKNITYVSFFSNWSNSTTTCIDDVIVYKTNEKSYGYFSCESFTSIDNAWNAGNTNNMWLVTDEGRTALTGNGWSAPRFTLDKSIPLGERFVISFGFKVAESKDIHVEVGNKTTNKNSYLGILSEYSGEANTWHEYKIAVDGNGQAKLYVDGTYKEGYNKSVSTDDVDYVKFNSADGTSIWIDDVSIYRSYDANAVSSVRYNGKKTIDELNGSPLEVVNVGFECFLGVVPFVNLEKKVNNEWVNADCTTTLGDDQKTLNITADYEKTTEYKITIDTGFEAAYVKEFTTGEYSNEKILVSHPCDTTDGVLELDNAIGNLKVEANAGRTYLTKANQYGRPMFLINPAVTTERIVVEFDFKGATSFGLLFSNGVTKTADQIVSYTVDPAALGTGEDWHRYSFVIDMTEKVMALFIDDSFKQNITELSKQTVWEGNKWLDQAYRPGIKLCFANHSYHI